ncbi:TPA: zinc permease [Candidatus Berkelbacteria bacterium]|nr:zinc permease [Candidatus Berkelbacteria bacterium]
MFEFIVKNLPVLVLAFLSGLATLLGVILGSHGKRSATHIAFGTAFAAGVMILISFFELIPGAYSIIQFKSLIWVTIGACVVWGINRILPHIHSVKAIEDCDGKCMVRMSYLLAIGLILHDFPEGFAIPSSFESSTDLGFLLVAATFIHNIPEGYVLTVASAKYNCNKFFYKSALFSGISTLSGAILGVILIHYFSFLNPIFLSIAAGAMLFISFHELIPTSLRIGRKRVLVAGGFVSFILYFLLEIAF